MECLKHQQVSLCQRKAPAGCLRVLKVVVTASVPPTGVTQCIANNTQATSV
jgi:hypothetical protein